ncbi:MAG: PIG-L deacetylase family protein [Opitutaceae bacterium]
MPAPLRILVVGAHPDDAEYKCGGSAARWVDAGHVIKFVSVTDGRSGHHLVPPEELVGIRLAETRAAANTLGIESEVLPFPDGSLEPSLEARRAIIRLVREWHPDLVLTHRPNDYHPDHRYTSQIVQDAAYMVMVPHVCPEFPPLQRNPAIFYLSDGFTRPYPFTPDAFVVINPTFDRKIKAMACHRSQFFEWLPHVEGQAEVPSDPAKREVWLSNRMKAHDGDLGRRHRERIPARLRKISTGEPLLLEAFEACEYGGRLTPGEFRSVFGHDPLETGSPTGIGQAERE